MAKIKEKPYCDPCLELGYDLGQRVEREKWQKALAEAIEELIKAKEPFDVLGLDSGVYNHITNAIYILKNKFGGKKERCEEGNVVSLSKEGEHEKSS